MIEQIDYMAFPFADSMYLPIDGCAQYVGDPFGKVMTALKERGVSPQEYLKRLGSMWKGRVEHVADNPDSMLYARCIL
ncbi:MAG: hypothetical protein ABIJ92_02770 [Candidatus Aenigmatarchaeota archaeon]